MFPFDPPENIRKPRIKGDQKEHWEEMGSFKCIKSFFSETVHRDFKYRAKNLFDYNNSLEHCRVTNVTVWDP